MAKTEDLSEKSNASLVNGLADAKRELFNLRFQLATGQLENTARINEVRKEVARHKTEIRAREIAAAESLDSAASTAPSAPASAEGAS
ncbi:MAG: 50S ribosomal protein L29 [Acidimicrobiia bacterium]|nr:50S ribosomal protein L29 [Acidimicrobiia bacterium]